MSDVDRVQRVYELVPRMACKGLCTDYCGAIAMSPIEEQRILSRHGRLPKTDNNVVCSELVDGRCAIYEDRPMICRLWGQVNHELLRCPHGCRPTWGLMSSDRAHQLLTELEWLSAGGDAE